MLGLATSLSHAMRYAEPFGWRGIIPAVKRTYTKNGRATVNTPGIGDLVLRPGCDWRVYDQIFIDGEHKIDWDIDPKLIIDAGANIGIATAYFATKYPDATIYAIEPSGDNFELLTVNTKRFTNVRRLQAAVWATESGSLEIANPDAESWAYKVKAGNGDIRGVTLPGILRESGAERIDVLKLDVEGAEVELLDADNCDEWLSKCRILLIELHDRLRLGCSKALYRRLLNRTYSQQLRGDVTQIDLRF